MTYALAEPLQRAIYGKLTADPNLSALVGADIFDAPLPFDGDATPDEYITIGPESVTDGATMTTQGALHDFAVTVHSNSQGFMKSKQVAGAVCDVLLDAEMELDRGELIYLRFLRAKADTGTSPEKRKILLKFRAFIEDV
jgi:hypothetical protein